jgi:hypothetical protein
MPGGSSRLHAVPADPPPCMPRSEREDGFLFIKADPDFGVLHADPGWHDVLRRMRLDS